jgi:3,4-dihydroxy 2-butanone 4-phosphate synthase/GTP cyclohydrolase II
MSLSFKAIRQAVGALQDGRMVVLFDHEQRENEGDLVLAAEKVTTAAINFMIREARGLICLPMAAKQIDRLQLPMMVAYPTNPATCAFTVSIEAAKGVTTGISAADRAETIRVASNPKSAAGDIVTPGHIFPLRARPGGVLERKGHTEASVELAQRAGLWPAAVICEILNPDGSMARLPDLKNFAARHQLPLLSISELVEYCQQGQYEN